MEEIIRLRYFSPLEKLIYNLRNSLKIIDLFELRSNTSNSNLQNSCLQILLKNTQF